MSIVNAFVIITSTARASSVFLSSFSFLPRDLELDEVTGDDFENSLHASVKSEKR